MVRPLARSLKLIPVAVVVLLALTHTLWLRAMGNFLVRADGPAHADIAVVLAGDTFGHRILKSCGLVREGYVPAALVSGPGGFWGNHECDLAIAFAEKRNCPREWFIRWPNNAHSTKEEADSIIPELRRRNVHSFLLVTSDFHTRRAGGIYRHKAPDLQMRVVAAPDEFFRANTWWQSRQGRKAFFLEWSKTLAELVGL